ncbi:MAG: restriction endonuclease subunit S [Bacteroidetes bacterium]|jgi:type I restriction enzyme S subunit|nr:restriction endonuclease subunit S [Bacteroidota bacterium]
MREDWTETYLPNVCDILDNLRKPINSNERKKRIEGKPESELYPYYGATGQVGYIDDYLTDGEFVLIGEDGAPFLDYTRAVAYKINGKTWVNNHAHILKSFFNNDYLLHYLNQFQFRDFVTGTTRLKLTQGALKRMSVKLAPLPEQRAIVTKIENLFASLDKGIADLKKAQEQLKVYRQALLKKAFEGELTKDWRKKQTKLPTAEELLEQIKHERQKYYEQQLEDWKQAVKDWENKGKEGKKPSRISKPKEFGKVRLIDVENYDTIPDNWKWSRFGNVTYKIGDIDHKMPKTVDNGYPYLSTGNLKVDGTIDFTEAKTISKEDFERLSLKIEPEKGDIIFPRYGTIGRNVLIDVNREFLVSYSCAIIKNITNMMSAKFALYYSLSPIIKKEIKKYTVETTQANVGIASIENFVFPLCSVEEQHQIVREIESRLSVCDKVEQNITEGLEKSEALRQSILKKAFEGKLLSVAEIEKCKQAADYEPASVLLEKIKKEKQK